MNRLIRVTLKRLVRDKFFWAAVAITLGLSLYCAFDNAPTMAQWAALGEEDYEFEYCFFNLEPLLGLIYAAFVSLFLGVEYSDGTLRNKLIAGHSRSSVLVSLFIVSSIGCLAITAAWFIGSLPCFIYFDGPAFGVKAFIIDIAVLICAMLVYSAIFTILSMLIPNKALSAVISLILWFVLLYVGRTIVDMLNVNEFIYDYVEQNGMYYPTGDPYPNPKYVNGAKRTVLETLSHIIPSCTALNVTAVNIKTPVFDVLYSLAASVVVLISGCAVFRKKDLK